MIWTDRSANPAADGRIQKHRPVVAAKRTSFEPLLFIHTEAIHIMRSARAWGTMVPFPPRPYPRAIRQFIFS
jgi:hypothetical protein